MEIQFAVNGSGETGQLHVKTEIRTFFDIIQKKKKKKKERKLKIDERPKCETRHYKILGGKQVEHFLT